MAKNGSKNHRKGVNYVSSTGRNNERVCQQPEVYRHHEIIEAIAAAYPHSQVQCCIIHQIRSSTRFVSHKDIKALMADLKLVYKTVAEDEARGKLRAFKEKMGGKKQYSTCFKSWEENWDMVTAQLEMMFSKELGA